MKQKFFSSLIMITSCLLYLSCNDDDNKSPTILVEKPHLSGFVEKGPFVNGSLVTIYELDGSLMQTGKFLNAATNNEGYFELAGTMDFVSNYIYLSVDGYYYNELTGERSFSQIKLDAIADIGEKNRLNANILTHLEYKRVLYLVNEEKKRFNEAKKQAENELLNCFLIKNETIIPEAVSIADNNKDANILIAISSIMLNAVANEDAMGKDAKLTILLNNFRDDFEKDGQISDQLKDIIKNASYKLDYIKVKENIQNKYYDLGKNVAVGNFHYFIDGDGDGILSDEDYDIGQDLSSDDYYLKDEHYKNALSDLVTALADAVGKTYLFEALFTNSIQLNNSEGYDLYTIYDHQINTRNSLISGIYSTFYTSIHRANTIIERGSDDKEFLKYKHACTVYRAYCYLTMVELWGDVPYVIRQLSINESHNISRTNKNAIISSIISDLTEIKNFLPDESDNLICSKSLVSALLANAYLQLKDYNNVFRHTSEIINSGKYSLCTNYSDIYTPSSRETLFSFNANEVNAPLFNELIRKGQDISIIRYASILLMSSEACLELNQLSDAVQYVNQVRERNKRPLLTGNASKIEIQSAILEEWEKDLAKEGAWFFALKRFGLAESALQIPAYMTLLPIPQREIDLTFGMTTQNPGY